MYYSFSGTTCYAISHPRFEIPMPRAFRICGRFFWDIPFHKIRLGRTVSSKVRMSWQEESVYELWWVMKFLETNAINLSQNEIRNDSCKIPIAVQCARARVAFAWRQKIFSLIEKKIYYSILIWLEFFLFEPRISKGEVLPKYKFFFHIRLYYSK